MKKLPLITVIIPTYKRHIMLEKAIKSVINQTYKNIEIIVVDDNKYNSKEHINTKNMINNYPNVRYYKNKKSIGSALSKNKGIELARGEYIAFLDDDDFFEPTKIEKQYNYYKKLNNKNVSMIYCYVRDLDSDYKEIRLNKKDYEGQPLYEHLIRFIATTSCWFCLKDILVKLGGFDNVMCQQDSTLILKMLINGYEIYRVPEVLLNFVIHDKERITNYTYEYIKWFEVYHNKCIEIYDRFNKKEICDIEYSFAIRIYDMYFELKDKKNVFIQVIKLWKLKLFEVSTFRKTIKFLLMDFIRK